MTPPAPPPTRVDRVSGYSVQYLVFRVLLFFFSLDLLYYRCSCIVLYCIVLCRIVLYGIVLNCYCIVLYCIAVYCIIFVLFLLYCIAL